MRAEHLLDLVESHDLVVTVNLASSLRSAVQNLLAEPSILELRQTMNEPQAAYQVLARVFDLTKLTTDIRYENPNDAALFAYAFLLAETQPSLAVAAAGAICQVPNLWWAAALATEIIDNRTSRNEASSQTPTAVGSGTDVVDRVFVTDPRWLLSPATRLVEFIVAAESDDETVTVRPASGTTWTEAADDTSDVKPAAA